MSMRYRRLGNTGLQVSWLALGTMPWGESVDEHAAYEQLTTFVEAGGTFIDTAANYAHGASEEVLGKLLAKSGLRNRTVVASKAGFRTVEGGVRRDASRVSMLRQLDDSLARLGTDHLDLWQVHIWDDAVPVEETLATLEHAVRTGRARYVGVSNYSGWQTAYANAWLAGRSDGIALAGTQVEYSLLNRHVETEVIPAALALNMGVVAWSPLGRGVLTGKYRTGIPGESRGAYLQEFVRPYLNPDSAAVVEALARAAEGLELAMNHVALAWLRQRPGVTAAIVGARDVTQLAQSLQSEEIEVPIEIIEALDDVSEVRG